MTARIATRQSISLPTPLASGAFHWDAKRLIDEIGRALAAMADASFNGDAVVREVAAQSFAAFAGGASARVVERVGEDWKYVDDGADVPGPVAGLLNDASHAAEVASVPGVGVLVPVSSGSIGVLLCGAAVPEQRWPALRVLATSFELALAAATQTQGKLDALEEISGLQQIARRILSAGDLDDILFSISQETKRLLSADICGVFLRDRDQMEMRHCVGNHTRNIAKIRLLRGQGLAGRVFATGLHCVVNDYLNSEIVSQEYAELVRAERIRSALGAPLRVNGELIGVLEVWRRRKSTFTEADVRRLLALSSLTAIAIRNAELYETQKSALEKLTQANDQLQKHNDVIRLSAEITGAVIQALLDGGGLPAIARIVADFAHAEVAFLNCDLQPMAGFHSMPWVRERLPAIESVVRKNGGLPGNNTITVDLKDGWLSVRRVIAGRDPVGWICALSAAQPGRLHEITIGQAAMATALNHLEQRAAIQARAESVGAVMWALLEGTAQARQTATGRAQEMQIDLSGPLRIVHFTVVGLDGAGDFEKAAAGATERRLKSIQEVVERALGKLGALRPVAVRDGLLVAAVTAGDGAQIRAMLRAVDDSIAREVSGLRTFWGVSAPCSDAGDLHSAHREAASATLLVRRLGFGRNVAIHEELGVVGLLLKVRSDADLGKFVKDTLSKVIAHDAKHHGVLTKTVRAYFECNCAQQATAGKLFVHEKTVRYRLNQFEALTGLYLNRHEDRMLVDLALGMHAIAGDEHGSVEASGILDA